MSEKLCEWLDFSVIKAAAALNGNFRLFLYLCTKMFRLKATIILIQVFQQSPHKPVCVCALVAMLCDYNHSSYQLCSESEFWPET